MFPSPQEISWIKTTPWFHRLPGYQSLVPCDILNKTPEVTRLHSRHDKTTVTTGRAALVFALAEALASEKRPHFCRHGCLNGWLPAIYSFKLAGNSWQNACRHKLSHVLRPVDQTRDKQKSDDTLDMISIIRQECNNRCFLHICR